MVDNVQGINPLGGPNGAGRLKKVYQDAYNAPRGADGVQMSDEVRRLSEIDGIRVQKVLEIKQQIANGTYLQEDKLNTALDRAIDEAYGSEKS